MTRRQGFTLVEVLVAIVVAAGVVATARGVLASIGDAGDRVAAAANAQDASMVGMRLVRSIVRHARESSDSTSLFGTDRGFVLNSLCPVSGGWSEPCQAAFAVDDSMATLVFRTALDAQPVSAMRAEQSIRLCYLVSASSGGAWVNGWNRSGLPVAIGVVMDRDTLILPVGR